MQMQKMTNILVSYKVGFIFLSFNQSVNWPVVSALDISCMSFFVPFEHMKNGLRCNVLSDSCGKFSCFNVTPNSLRMSAYYCFLS